MPVFARMLSLIALLLFVDKIVRVSLSENKTSGSIFVAIFKVVAKCFVYVLGFVALAMLFVVSNFSFFREQLNAVLCDETIAFIRNVLNVTFGTPSVFLALQKALVVAILSAEIVVFRCVFAVGLVALFGIILLFFHFTQHLHHSNEDSCNVQVGFSSRWLVFCRFIS